MICNIIVSKTVWNRITKTEIVNMPFSCCIHVFACPGSHKVFQNEFATSRNKGFNFGGNKDGSFVTKFYARDLIQARVNTYKM